MNSALKTIIYVILIFGFVAIGTESVRVFKIYIDLQSSIETMSTDSIELAVYDDYRAEHVTIMDESLCKDLFIQKIRTAYNLGSNLSPDSESFMKTFVLEELSAKPGDYEIGINSLIQRGEPELYVNGYITTRPLILGFNKDIKIPFEFTAHSRRR